jgi:hypothetical protein
MELRLVILHEFFAGVRLQPVFNQINAIEVVCLCFLSFDCAILPRLCSNEWVKAGHKEEVVSRLATKHRRSYSREKLVDLCEGAMSTR